MTYCEEPAVELDHHGDAVAGIHLLLVGKVEVYSDAKVAADDNNCRHGEVEGEDGHHERESLLFHLTPGQRAGYAERLGAITSPSQNGKHGPDHAVQPDPQAHDLH